MDPVATTTAILSMKGVTKHFDGVHALRSVDLELRAGEVRALVGANGSGKSTLVKVLAGYHLPEAGAEIFIHGKPYEFAQLSAAQIQLHLGVVHQELGLIHGLSALENYVLPSFATANSWHIDWGRMHREAGPMLARFEIDNPRALVDSLPRVKRALLALARAVRSLELTTVGDTGAPQGVLVLDEITAFLPYDEVRLLHRVVRTIAQAGHSVLFVSHDLDEVMSFADTVTVLRDGQRVAERAVQETNLTELFELIVGNRRALASALPAETKATSGSIEVTAAGVYGSGLASFQIAKGEILGLTGLLGSGFEEIPYVLFGGRRDAVGAMTLGGKRIPLASLRPAAAMRHGVALVPGDRLKDGLIDTLSIGENVGLPQMSRFARRGRLNWAGLWSYARDVISRYRIVARLPTDEVTTLSGGNQQRVLVAKWFEMRSPLVLLHDPVRGVDVAARDAIVALLREYLQGGSSVVCATSDYEFLAAACDRILVFREGTIAHELVRDPMATRIDKEQIVWACLNSGASEPSEDAAGANSESAE